MPSSIAKTPNAYSNLFAKVFLWLETKNPAQDWHACVVFASRALAPTEERPYRALLASDQVTRIYLDELPEAKENQFGLGILEILGSSRKDVPARAKTWLKRIKAKTPVADEAKLVELIQTVVLCHFPKLTRKELEAMIEVTDVRKTRVYQDARQEGREEVALRLLARDFSVSEVADLTGLSVAHVRKLKKNAGKS
jgi:predicted transposase YdaD